MRGIFFDSTLSESLTREHPCVGSVILENTQSGHLPAAAPAVGNWSCKEPVEAVTHNERTRVEAAVDVLFGL